MRLHVQSVIWLQLLYNVITLIPVISGQEFQLSSLDAMVAQGGDRDKRAFDLGWLVRNFLLKSASASNSKADISRNVINLKTTTTTTPRPTTRRRPVPTTFAPFLAKKSFLFDLSSFSGGFPAASKFNNVPGVRPGPGPGPGPLPGGVRGGYLNFDYDYVDQSRPAQLQSRRRRPTTTTAPVTTMATTTRASSPATQPPALPLKRRPLPQRPQFANYDYYDDEYDYGDAEPTTPAPPPPPPQPRRSRPRRPQQNEVTPAPRNGARQDRPSRLRNPAIYQYAQTNDFSTNNNNDNGATAAAAVDNAAPAASENKANPNDANNQSNTNANDDTSQDTNEADNANVADAGNEAAFDPSNSEDYNDSSDNSNPLSNGNGSNANDISLNDLATNGNDATAQNPLFDFNNNNAVPPTINVPSATPSDQPNFNAQFINPRNFNGRGPAPSLPRINQPFGLPTNYQNFQYPSFNDYSRPYQQSQPSSPFGYSVRYY